MNTTVEVLEKFFLWMTVINFCLLTFYSILFLSARNFIYRIHSRWFKISEEKMSSTLYKILAYYKVAIIGFNLVPYIAIRLSV